MVGEGKLYIFNVPIWNNGIPDALRQLIVLVTQPGWSFGIDLATGYTGLITRRKVVGIHASVVWFEWY